jgi:hypothetical protein
MRNPFAEKHQQILQISYIGSFSADTLYGTTCIFTGFLTLKAKHFFHILLFLLLLSDANIS